MTDTTPLDATSSPADLARFLEMIREREAGTLIERMQIEVTELSAERVVATMPVEGNTQPAGLLHGGATAALAETVGSYGALAHAGMGRAAVGLELSVSHHRSARSGTVTAVATALHLGRTLASYEIVVSDDDNKRLCTARLTCMVMDGR
jgi:1,4-dihydroxy-2-naphthoyl-CoA hydrolase